MRKRIMILAVATVLVVAFTTVWAVAGRRLIAQGNQAPVGFIPSKYGGWKPDPSTARYFGISPEVRAATRQEWSGCKLYAPFDFLADKVDPDSLDALAAQFEVLAAQFRTQAPVPPDRVEHFAWTDQARDVVTFIGWGASIHSAERQGDDWLLELSVEPKFECETAMGGLVYDRYYETYLFHDGFFTYQGGRTPEGVRHVIWPDPGRPEHYSFD